MQRGVGRGIGRIWSKGTNFQSTTQPGQAAGPGDPALPASAPGPRSTRSPGAETLSASPPPAHRSREPETPSGARRARLPPPARRGRCSGASSRPPAPRRHALLQAIQALQKDTRLLLRKTPSATCNSLIQPASRPFPCPERLSPPLPPPRPGEPCPPFLNSLELTPATS